jgi:hypothetical protein
VLEKNVNFNAITRFELQTYDAERCCPTNSATTPPLQFSKSLCDAFLLANLVQNNCCLTLNEPRKFIFVLREEGRGKE